MKKRPDRPKVLDLSKMKIELPKEDLKTEPKQVTEVTKPPVKVKMKVQADDSPVCSLCKRKGENWFKEITQTCGETGKKPIFIEKVFAE